MKKRLFAPLIVLVLAGCANPRPYTYREAPPPPPPPYEGMQPYQGPQTQRPQQTPPQPHVPKTAMPSYSGGTAGPVSAKTAGAYMDGLERDLRHYLRGIPVARPGDLVVLNLRSDEMFDHGGLSGGGRDLLRNLSAALRHYDHTSVEVTGFTDTRGTPDENLKTSQKRADAVAAELRDDGIAARRISATGVGRSRLKIKTGDGVSEPRNRRIEIKIVPKPG